MLTHPTYDRLLVLGLTGMAKALEEQRRQRNVEGLSFEERLGLLVDREAVERESKRLVLRLKYANLRQSAVVEDLDTQAARGLDKALFAKLAAGEWIARRQDLLITGKTGTGKSWLACALGHKACRDDRSVLYYRVPRLLDALALARGDGRYPRLLKSLTRVDLLILDLGEVQSYVEFPNRCKVRNGLWPSKLHITNSGHHSRFSQSITSTAAGDRWPA
jgi:DNA replication protein DnaC